MTRVIPNSDRIQFYHSLPVAGRVSVNILRNGDLLVLDDTRSIIASGVITYGFVEWDSEDHQLSDTESECVRACVESIMQNSLHPEWFTVNNSNW